MHSMDEWPPAQPLPNADCSVNVILHYPDDVTWTGYRDGWTGWMRWDELGIPQPCEDDATQPIGWSELEVKS